MLDYRAARRSSISCWRRGILSIEREISRTSQGAGLRNSTSPSLPMITNMNPRGRNRIRSGLSVAGEVSVRMITSRSARSSARSRNRSSCWRNRGSLGLSAKTTTGRASQINSSTSKAVASKTAVLSASHNSAVVGAVSSWAVAAPAKQAKASAAKNRIILLPFKTDIGSPRQKAKAKADIFIFNRIVTVLVHSSENAVLYGAVCGAARPWGECLLDIVLHLGAHRCATTTFQTFLWANRVALAKSGLTCWTPRRTRDGLMHGLMKHPALITLEDEEQGFRSVGRIRLEVDRLARAEQSGLLISEENIIGTMRNNLADTRLYPLLHERLRRFVPAFEGARLTIGLCVRTYEEYWASALAKLVAWGGAVPSAYLLDFLTTQPRRWRSMVRDIAAIFPEAEIVVWPFERLAGRPQDQLRLLWQAELPSLAAPDLWRNRSNDIAALNAVLALRGETLGGGALTETGTRWMPFDEDQTSVLRAEYRRDIAWLKAGAEGLATYVEGRPTRSHPDACATPCARQMNDGQHMPASRPDRADVTQAAQSSAAAIGGRSDGIEERLGRTSAN